MGLGVKFILLNGPTSLTCAIYQTIFMIPKLLASFCNRN